MPEGKFFSLLNFYIIPAYGLINGQNLPAWQSLNDYNQ